MRMDKLEEEYDHSPSRKRISATMLQTQKGFESMTRDSQIQSNLTAQLEMHQSNFVGELSKVKDMVSATMLQTQKMGFESMTRDSQIQSNLTAQLEMHQSNFVGELSKVKDMVSAISTQMKQINVDLMEEVSHIRNVSAQLKRHQNNLMDVMSEMKDAGLIKQLCPKAWLNFNKKCYYFLNNSLTWENAKDTCSGKQAHLVVINNIAEQLFLSLGNSRENWIGLSDIEKEGQWQWVDGTSYELTPKHWKAGEPNDSNNAEDCACLATTGKWNDIPCHLKKTAICERNEWVAEQ
ncbi:C-type lectin domain family 4 member E isoform X2 [Callorhinchus milii]|uniref:C-type lectin domain family 4 member E isoform X2 n=1 Tax=Callorhinchus milii TaxID=7868 RepID=UPI001C3F7AF3|nr:C-type lectin domain family 4 member E isoform X2 [Callorhinchus milii]